MSSAARSNEQKYDVEEVKNNKQELKRKEDNGTNWEHGHHIVAWLIVNFKYFVDIDCEGDHPKKQEKH